MKLLARALPLRERLFGLANRGKSSFTCPICRYAGPFRDLSGPTGRRLHARCTRCGALERHRLQMLVLQSLFGGRDTGSLRMLHFAPEKHFRPIFMKMFGGYETADLCARGVDHRVDLQRLPFPGASYDVVYASHVLEHVPDDAAAIREIRRVLAPGGLAILPVPIVNPVTVDYPEPNARESMHVRAPGPDYFDRYRPHFSRVDLYRSGDFPERYQLYAYEDRTGFPSARSPLLLPTAGSRHEDIVPVCLA